MSSTEKAAIKVLHLEVGVEAGNECIAGYYRTQSDVTDDGAVDIGDRLGILGNGDTSHIFSPLGCGRIIGRVNDRGRAAASAVMRGSDNDRCLRRRFLFIVEIDGRPRVQGHEDGPTECAAVLGGSAARFGFETPLFVGSGARAWKLRLLSRAALPVFGRRIVVGLDGKT